MSLLVEKYRPNKISDCVLPKSIKKMFEDISPSMISKLVDKLIENARDGKLSPNTIKRIYSDLKHFFQWSVEEGYLDKMPRFPKTNGEAARRPHFDPRDWQRLTRHLREFVKIENKAVLRDRKMLVDYVLTLWSSAAELRHLFARPCRP